MQQMYSEASNDDVMMSPTVLKEVDGFSIDSNDISNLYNICVHILYNITIQVWAFSSFLIE